MGVTQVSSLIERAKAMADIRDNFVTTEQWQTWATQERYNLELLLIRSGWSASFLSAIITVDGTENGVFDISGYFPIGDNRAPMAIMCIHEVNDQGYLRLLKMTNSVSFLRQLPGSTTGVKGHAREYRLHWSDNYADLELNFFPEPSVGERYVVHYIPEPLALVVSFATNTQTTNVSYPLGWEERIVQGMAKRALIKEESDPSLINQEIAEIERRIEEHIWSTNISTVASIRNVDKQEYGWYDKLIFPQPSFWWWA